MSHTMTTIEAPIAPVTRSGIDRCRMSGEPLVPNIDFGRQPLGNGFLMPEQFADEYFYSMRTGYAPDSMMYQLCEQPTAERMFHDHYAFYSSTSQAMSSHFADFANAVRRMPALHGAAPFVVELGCNDGILIRHFAQAGMRHLGIEPSSNVAAVARSHGVDTLETFFTEDSAAGIVAARGQADAILAANVMCHIGAIDSVARGIRLLLRPTGILAFEDPYLGDVIAKTSYDQIYDEHAFLFSAHSVQRLFGRHGLELIAASPQPTHGGSMRYILAHAGACSVEDSVHAIIERERALGLHETTTYHAFAERVASSRIELVDLLSELKHAGKRVVGYGATSKSTTILNYAGIGPDLIEFIADTTPIKQGKYSPGMHIPVRPYEAFVTDPPDYAVLFAWNHSAEIRAKERGFEQAGGRWIVHVPRVGVL